MISQRVLARAFVGRSAELEHLAACRRAAAASRGGGVIVAGEAGIGKTRLVREYELRFCVRAPAASGACRPFGSGTFDPLLQVLARVDAGAQAALRGAATKDEQVDAILAAFARAAAKRVMTAIVEDVHWAPPDLIDVLALIARWAANRRLLLIMTCRDADVAPSTPAFAALARVARESTLLRLQPLDSREIGVLMTDALTAVEAAVTPEIFADVRRRSAGNPLFAEELLRNAVDGARDARDAVASRALPLSLQGVLRERLDRCDVADREFLGAAAVLGGRFRVDILERVFSVDGETAAGALARLIELQLLDRTADPLVYAFRHALTREVVYGDLVPARARALHVRVAEAVASLPDADAHAELLAHSFWESGLPARAAPHAERAAEAAMAVFAYEDAVLWYERAAAGYGDRVVDAARALGKASVALNRLNEPKRAQPLYERAIAALAASGDVAGAVRMRTYLAATLYNDGREREAFENFEAALAHACDAAAPAAERHARIRLFTARVLTRDLAAACALRDAIDESALEPDGRDTFDYYVAKAHLHTLLGELGARRLAIANAFATLERRGHPPNEQRHAYAYVASDAFGIGEMEEAQRCAQHALEIARRMRSEIAYTASVLAQIEARAGNLRRAREHVNAVAAAPEFLSRLESTLAAIEVALAAGDEAQLAAAIDLDLVREAERGGHRNSVLSLRAMTAAGLARAGRHAEAAALARGFADAVDDPFGRGWEIVAVAGIVPDTVAHLRAVVAASAAAEIPLNRAVCAYLDALIALEDDDAERCAAFAREAAAGFAAIGWPLVEAQARELAGDMAGALAIYRRVGCTADVRRMEREVPRAGVLSPRERELAQLIADGRNNREAADAMCVSRKAVEKYLTSIYRKLGITSRTQLTRYVAVERGPAPRETGAAGRAPGRRSAAR